MSYQHHTNHIQYSVKAEETRKTELNNIYNFSSSFGAQHPKWGLGRLVVEVSRSHTHTQN